MAFSSTIINTYKSSGIDIVVGTFTNDNTSGGSVDTGLSRVEMFKIQPLGDSTTTNQPSVSITLPSTNGLVTVVTDSDSRTYGWIAFGSK